MVARKTSTAPTRIWKCAARVADDKEVMDILFQSRRYYNVLVEIERRRQERYAEIRRRHAPELAALEDDWRRRDDEIDGVFRAVKEARGKHWRESDGEKRRLLPPDAEVLLSALRSEQKRLGDALKEQRKAFAVTLEPAREEYRRRTTERAVVRGADGVERKVGPRTKSQINETVLAEMLEEAVWADAWKDLARSDERAHADALAARERCELATGTYLVTEEAFQRAKRDSLPRAPRFRRFDGQGKLAVQVRDKRWIDVIAGCPTLSIPGKRGRKHRITRVRILMDQSIPRSSKRSIAISADLHRLPPEDADVKWLALVVRRIGSRITYELQVTLEHETFAEPKRPAGERPAVHVAIGWAGVNGGVRVASLPEWDVVVPNAILAQHEYASAVESAADRHYERAKRRLRLWARLGGNRMTAWHRMGSDRERATLRRVCAEYATHVLGDVHAVWIAWRQERLGRGEDLYAEPCVLRRWLVAHGLPSSGRAVMAFWAYAWARKDQHLSQLAVDSRRRFVNRRDDLFRREAVRIATEFAAVTVDKYSIAGLKELPELTRSGELPREVSQRNLQAAAPGRFREILREVMGPRCTPCERSGDEKRPATARKRKGKEIAQEAGGTRMGAVDAEE